jgi:ABC-type phosphate transport system auxiliary subunit
VKYTTEGKEMAMATTKKLGSNLTQKMKEGGVKEAVPFCNTMAYSLTDEMSKKYNAEIKRTSDKLRNEKNKPNDEEKKIIEDYKKAMASNKQLKPVVAMDASGNPHFYAPIILKKKCMTCHGAVGGEVSVTTDSLIRSYYPNDKAVGFKEGDLRGIWSIKFLN